MTTLKHKESIENLYKLLADMDELDNKLQDQINTVEEILEDRKAKRS